MRLALLGLMATIMLAGCDSKPAEPIGAGAAFDPIAFFDGHTHSWGVIEGRSAAPTEWVVTDSHGVRGGAEVLRMQQHLSFQDSAAQDRNWVLRRTGENRFEATANDMVGTAQGEADGNVFHWQWTLARSPGNPLMNVTMAQWMYRLPDGSVMIRTTVSKLGFIVAEVSEQFTHVS